MRPTEILTEEHNCVKVILRVLDVMCVKLKAGEKVEPGHIEGAVDFIKNFADRAHHMKEEDLLFPAMEAAGVSKEKSLVDAITTEHDLGRGHVRGLTDALSLYSIGDNGAGLMIAENAAKYVKLIKDHIAREEDIVFPLADRHLSDDSQRDLAARFDKIDKDVIGEARRQEFMEILSTLKGAYLGEGEGKSEAI